MRLLKRGALVLGLMSCVLCLNISRVQARGVEYRVSLTPIGIALLPEFSASSASARIREDGGKTEIRIKVYRLTPNEFYTVWIRLNGTNPLTGTRSTACAPTTAMDDLLEVTPPHRGSTDVINGFWTDGNGNGEFRIELDFPLSGGVYPFDQYDTRLAPVLVKREADNAGGTLRVVSHLTDGLGHGLEPGTHEGWFDWALP